MRWWIKGLTVTALLAMGPLVSVSAAAEEGSTPPQFHFDDDYRAPVGPPAPRGKSDVSVSDHERAAEDYEKSRSNEALKNNPRGPLGIDLLPNDLLPIVFEVARITGAKVNYYNRHRLYVDQRLASGTLVEVLEFAPDTIRSRQFDSWDRMGRLPGFGYLDNTVGEVAFRFEPGTGPFPRCLHYSAFERKQGLCPEDNSRYILVTPGDFAGQR